MKQGQWWDWVSHPPLAFFAHTMNSRLCLDGLLRSSSFPPSQIPKIPFPYSSNILFPPCLISSENLCSFRNAPSPTSLLLRLCHGSVGAAPRARVSSDGRESFPGRVFHDETELQPPSFVEFITSERVKVVAMLALALSLCNADRVVMSVAVVPLSLSHGWSRSFGGVVQVILSLCIGRVSFSNFTKEIFSSSK